MSKVIYTPFSYQEGGTDTASYKKVSPVRPGNNVEGKKTPFWRHYYRASGTTNVGLSTAVNGKPQLDSDHVLSNCIGLAQGRFSEIYAQANDVNYDYQAGSGFAGDTDGSKLAVKADWTYDTDDKTQVKKIQPGTIFCYVLDGDTTYSKIHAGVVEKIVATDEDGCPLKVETINGHYGANKYITRDTVYYNSGDWTYGNYKTFGYIFNPGVKAFTLPDKYTQLDSLTSINNKRFDISNLTYKAGKLKNTGLSFLMKFKTPDNVNGRILLLGNHIGDGKNNTISFEICYGQLRIYFNKIVNGKEVCYDSRQSFKVSPNTEYIAKFSYKNKQFYIALADVDCDVKSGTFDITGYENKGFSLFKDSRANSEKTFTKDIELEWLYITSDCTPVHYYVPVSVDNSIGLYDLVTGTEMLEVVKTVTEEEILTAKVDELTLQIEEFKKEVENLTSTITNLDSELATQETEIENLTNENAELKKKIANAMTALK